MTRFSTRAIAAAISLLSASWLASALVLVVGFTNQPQPAPIETPRMWVHPSSGGACYWLKDELGPCFRWGSPLPSPEATP